MLFSVKVFPLVIGNNTMAAFAAYNIMSCVVVMNNASKTVL